MLFREGRIGLGVQYIHTFCVKKEEKERACLGWLVSS